MVSGGYCEVCDPNCDSRVEKTYVLKIKMTNLLSKLVRIILCSDMALDPSPPTKQLHF